MSARGTLSPVALAVLQAVEQAGAAGLTTRELCVLQQRHDGADSVGPAYVNRPWNLATAGYLARIGDGRAGRWVRTDKALPLGAQPAAAPPAAPEPVPAAAPADPWIYIRYAGRRVPIPAHARSVFDLAAGAST